MQSTLDKRFVNNELSCSGLGTAQAIGRQDKMIMQNSEKLNVGLQVLAQLQLPARIGPQACAKLLGMAEHDIPILVAAGMLHPLGRPTPS